MPDLPGGWGIGPKVAAIASCFSLSCAQSTACQSVKGKKSLMTWPSDFIGTPKIWHFPGQVYWEILHSRILKSQVTPRAPLVVFYHTIWEYQSNVHNTTYNKDPDVLGFRFSRTLRPVNLVQINIVSASLSLSLGGGAGGAGGGGDASEPGSCGGVAKTV